MVRISLITITPVSCSAMLRIAETTSFDVEVTISWLENTIKVKYPHILRLFIEAQSMAGYHQDIDP
ncbi:MAG: hypothetical protein VX693_09110 [Pseudomonadota bacterium]|nr:hypothetical protein [Pseudomonadota bacterium]